MGILAVVGVLPLPGPTCRLRHHFSFSRDQIGRSHPSNLLRTTSLAWPWNSSVPLPGYEVDRDDYRPLGATRRSCQRVSGSANGSRCGFLIIIPKPSPSQMKSIPATSNTCRIRSNVRVRSCSPRSRRLTVWLETPAAAANSRIPHPIATRASLH